MNTADQNAAATTLNGLPHQHSGLSCGWNGIAERLEGLVSHSLLALGYAGWGPGQLEAEIQENAWLHTEVDADLLFGTEAILKWPLAMAKLGIDLSMLSTQAGHA